MCSVQEGDSFPEARQRPTGPEGVCRKCRKEKPSVVIRVSDQLCRSCFLQHCNHKFRSAFGKTKIIRDGEKVLVAYSGGSCSTALLNLVQTGLGERTKKKLRFTPTFVHVIERCVLNINDHFLDGIQDILETCGYPYQIVPLENALTESARNKVDASPGENEDDVHVSGLSNKQTMQKLFNESTKTLSAKEDLLIKLRNNLLTDVAKSLNCSKIIVGNCCTDVAINILSDIAKGRGAHLPIDTGFVDSRDDTVTVVRPLREFSSKEAAYYNKLQGLEPFVCETLTSKKSVMASINRLTEDFVVSLQNDFPSTVSTIFRTGDKLRLGDNISSAEQDILTRTHCRLCKGPVDVNHIGDCTAVDAKRFSDIISKGGERISDTDREGHYLGTPHYPSICYGCSLIARDMDPTATLPVRTFPTD